MPLRRTGFRLTALLLALSLASACNPSPRRLFAKAESYWRQGNYEEAARHYERIYTKYSTDVLADRALFEAAEVHYYNLRRINRAILLYRKLLSAYPTSPFKRRAHLRLAAIYQAEIGDLRQAVEHWRAALALGGEDQLEIKAKIADAYLKLAENSEQLAEALNWYKEISAEGRDQHLVDQANLRIGQIYQLQGKHRLSIEPLSHVAEKTSCAQCRLAAKRALIESHLALDDQRQALAIADSLELPAAEKERELRRIAAHKRP